MTEPTTNRKLTSEDLARRFDSPFDLVNHAIACGENLIYSGRPPRVKSSIDNPAYIVLEEIRQGVDHMVPIARHEERDDRSTALIQATNWQDPVQRASAQ